MSSGNSCPQCGSKNLIEDRRNGELVCAECGYVVSTIPDRGPEWRSYGFSDEGRVRVGAPLTFLLHDMGLSTLIEEEAMLSRSMKKALGKQANPSLMRALSEIHTLSSKMGLPESVAETAALIYRRAHKRGLVAKKMGVKMAVASLYLACKLFKVPKMAGDFTKAAGIDRRTLARCYRKLVNGLSLQTAPPSHGLIVSRIVNQLRLKGDVEFLSNLILDAARGAGFTLGRKPESMAAAAIYISTVILGYRVSQRALARAASITEVTLRNRYKELLKKMDIEVFLGKG